MVFCLVGTALIPRFYGRGGPLRPRQRAEKAEADRSGARSPGVGFGGSASRPGPDLVQTSQRRLVELDL